MPRLPTNIVKRGDRFYFRKEVDGKTISKSLGPRLDEAKRLAAIERQKLLGAPQETAGTVESFSKRWLKEYVKQRRNEKGVKLASQRLQDVILPVVGHLSLSAVKTVHLRAVRALGEGEGRGPQTAKHILSDLRCLLRYAVEAGEISFFPSFRMVMPKIPEEAPKRLSDEEVDKILATLPDRHQLPVRLSLLTGLRWGEVSGLLWRRVVWKPKPHLVLEKTKSGKVRRVPLFAEAAALLKEEFKKTSSVFVVETRIKGSDDIARPNRKLSGVRWHYHQLRHTYACRWLEAGGSKEALQKILGHSTIRLTERYGDLSDEAVFWEAERIESRITPREEQKQEVVAQ